MTIVDIHGVVRFHCSFFTECPRAFTLTALTSDSRNVGVFLFRVYDYGGFRTVQAGLQTAASVDSSHNFVSGGNGDTLLCYS